MAKAEASVKELVGMIERGELRLPEMPVPWSKPCHTAGTANHSYSTGQAAMSGDPHACATCSIRFYL